MNHDESSKSKLAIDEDWKAKVEAEREALDKNRGEQPSAPAAPPATSEPVPESSSAAPGTESKSDANVRLPPASLESLVTMLATQAMVALGQIPDPVQNKAVLRLQFARHYIDTLGVLEEKTKGNLSNQEARLLGDVLNDLRLAFVALKK